MQINSTAARATRASPSWRSPARAWIARLCGAAVATAAAAVGSIPAASFSAEAVKRAVKAALFAPTA